MVHGMEGAEQGARVHKAVRPVEVRIVHQDHERDAQTEVHPAVLRDIEIELRVRPDAPGCDHSVHQSEDQDRNDRVPDLARKLRQIRHRALELPAFLPSVPGGEGEARECEVAESEYRRTEEEWPPEGAFRNQPMDEIEHRVTVAAPRRPNKFALA